MAIAVKDISAIAKKFVARAGVAAGDYTAGVNGTTKDQAALAIAAKDSWAAGVQAAVQNGSYVRGLTKSGTAKWKANAAGIGASRYAPGVANAQQAYVTGFGPYLTVLQNLTLSQRYPRGDPRNTQRVIDVNTALNKARTSGTGG
jgi:hypothetical protein